MILEMMATPPDHVDAIVKEWTTARPDIDTSTIAVIGRVSRLSRLFERRTGETFSAFGLTRGGFAVLASLRRSGPPFRLSPTQLYNSLLVSSGAMTNRIDRLEESGLVARFPDDNDRRGVLVGLTTKGLKLIDKVITKHIQVEQDLLRSLTRSQRTELAKLLRIVASDLEAEAEKGSVRI